MARTVHHGCASSIIVIMVLPQPAPFALTC